MVSTHGHAVSGAQLQRRWIVLLEAVANTEASLVDIGTARAILVAMGDEDGVGLHGADRIAVQVRVDATDPAMALCSTLARWQPAAGRLLPPGWDVVRAEVLTPEELKYDCEVG